VLARAFFILIAQVARKKAEQRKKEKEVLDQKLENMTPDQRRKVEEKIHKQEMKKKASKGKVINSLASFLKFSDIFICCNPAKL
jgi:hypothetical protein